MCNLISQNSDLWTLHNCKPVYGSQVQTISTCCNIDFFDETESFCTHYVCTAVSFTLLN